MIKFIKILLILLSILFSKFSYSLTPSSYLIVNAAISSLDYDTAANFFKDDNYTDYNIRELRKIIFSLVNSNKIKEAGLVANQMLKAVNEDEDAWLVLLTLAKLNNDFKPFDKFEALVNKGKFDKIYYIFYENNQINKSNEAISWKFFDLIQQKDTMSLYQPETIDHYLFYLSLVLNFKSNFNEILYIQAQVYHELKYYIKAAEIYNKIQPQHDLYIEAQKNIIIINKNIKQFDEAEIHLIKLINLYPSDNSLIVLLADLYRSNKQYNKAIEFYNLLIHNNNIGEERLWKIYYKRGICYERLNMWSEAEKDLLKSLKYKPEQPQVLNYLAYGWIEKNFHINKSLKMLEVAIQKDPTNHYILDSLAWAHYKNNNLIKAVEIMEKVLEIAPGEAISIDHLGDIYFSLGRKREAYFMWVQAKDLAEPEDDIIESIQIKLNKYNAG